MLPELKKIFDYLDELLADISDNLKDTNKTANLIIGDLEKKGLINENRN